MTKTKKIILIVAVIALVAVAGWYGFKKYERWSFWREMKTQAEKFESEQARLKSLVEADIYGGQTPQETLSMFIAAVEAGNYDLASKYFVVEKQEKWENMLSQSTNNNEFINDLKKNILLNMNNGQFSKEGDWFRLDKPVSIEFMRRPNGNWKIIEI